MFYKFIILLLFSCLFGDIIHVPSDDYSIQDAIYNAGDVDTVVVYQGVYQENLLIDKSITLISLALFDTATNTIVESLDGWVQYNSTFAAWEVANELINSTIIDGSGELKSTITIATGNDLCIEPLILGFTIQNGAGTLMDRFYDDTDSTFTLQQYIGGGILSYLANPILHYNKIQNNGTLQDVIKSGSAIYAATSSDDIDFIDRRSEKNKDCGNALFNFTHNFFENNYSSLGRHIGNRYFEGDIDLSNSVFDYWNCQDEGDYQTPIWVNIDDIDNLVAENEQNSGCLLTGDAYVDPIIGNDDLNDGQSWDSPFYTITHAIALVIGTENAPINIYLSEGTFSPSTNGETFPIIMIPNINLIGQGEEVTKLDAALSNTVLTIENCINNTISNLSIINGFGNHAAGGIFITNSDPSLSNIIIDNNLAGHGAGMQIIQSSPIMTDVIISNNKATYSAGGMDVIYYSNPILNNVTIEDNIAGYLSGDNACGYGGGMLLMSYSNPVFNGVLIRRNTATCNGGGMLIEDSNPLINNIIISNNFALHGGGIHFWNTEATLTGININNNISEDDGGGICIDDSQIILKNTNFDGNTSLVGEGGGIMSWGGSSLNATNVTISNNSSRYGAGIYLYDTETILTDLTILNNSAGKDGGGIIIDECNNAIITNINVANNSAGSSDEGTGCGGGMSIWDSNPMLTKITLSNNSAFWCGGGIDIFQSSPIIEDLTVNGNISHWGGGIHLYNCIIPLFSNVNLSNNEATEGGGLASYNNIYSNVFTDFEFVLNDVDIINNIAEQGAGILLKNSRSSLNNVMISGNHSTDDGGGISIESSNTLFNNVTITQNTALDDGGGIFIDITDDNSNAPYPSIFKDVIISNNRSEYGRGGGMYFETDIEVFTANKLIITNNNSSGHGGGIFLSAGSNINLQHATIAGNMVGEGDVFGAGIYSNGGTANIVNSIVYYNRREEEGGPSYNLNGWSQELFLEFDISYSDIEGDENWIPDGEGNISINPEFVDHEYLDYTLQPNSPCIDTGTIIEDMEYCGDAPDMGAYEYCEEECGAELADVNGDSEINILDLVQIANLILETSTPPYACAADFNGDGEVNILDLVQIANYILEN